MYFSTASSGFPWALAQIIKFTKVSGSLLFLLKDSINNFSASAKFEACILQIAFPVNNFGDTEFIDWESSSNI